MDPIGKEYIETPPQTNDIWNLHDVWILGIFAHHYTVEKNMFLKFDHLPNILGQTS